MKTKTHWLQSPNKNYLGHWDLPESQDLILTIQSAKREEVENPVLRKDDPKKFVQTVIESYIKSEKAVSDIKLALLGFKLLKEYHGREGLDRTQRKEIASDFWSKEKQNNNLVTAKKFDHLIVGTLTKSLPKSHKGGRRR